MEKEKQMRSRWGTTEIKLQQKIDSPKEKTYCQPGKGKLDMAENLRELVCIQGADFHYPKICFEIGKVHRPLYLSWSQLISYS